MAETEKVYRAKTGWIERTIKGIYLTYIQRGGLKTLDDAIKEAQYVEDSWVERDGQPAHIPTHTRLPKLSKSNPV